MQTCVYFQERIWVTRGWLAKLFSCFVSSDKMIVDQAQIQRLSAGNYCNTISHKTKK